MARKKNTSTNPILYFKPNQFPGSRIGPIQWARKAASITDTNTSQDEESTDTEEGTRPEAGTLDYYKGRFAGS